MDLGVSTKFRKMFLIDSICFILVVKSKEKLKVKTRGQTKASFTYYEASMDQFFFCWKCPIHVECQGSKDWRHVVRAMSWHDF